MIICKSAIELEKMRRAGVVVWEVLQELKAMVKPGLATLELEKVAAQRIAERGARAAFKGLYNYPCVLCTSINDEIVHGIPSAARKVREGDLLKIDVGAEVEGYYGDSAITVPVGEVSPALQQLVRVTEESLYAAIDRVRLGSRVGDVSSAVEQYVTRFGYSVVRDFVGHGIGSRLHEDPKVPNYGTPGVGPKLKEGMVLAIEPMVNTGKSGSRVLRDQWTAVTEDGGYSAHFEHTVVVTGNGPWILTRP
ncbi:MAG: type I methionyl aminopeptidase [Acidobacteria bacterium RIFCSPLOWO2_02_FULL_60_20]|nr:MAG: type I methionyl aminopeptidase [Acidobacteria bacterium RIFCSPLOWO2_02_FULL_60_20]OFW45436.1 MAG: type I methionyl aminopeptidase [Acidobacteria bacterium RIFCSPLOWO2_12_FULL_60_22]